MSYVAIADHARPGDEIWALVDPVTMPQVWEIALLRVARDIAPKSHHLRVVWCPDARLWGYVRNPANPYPGVVAGPIEVPWRFRAGQRWEIEIHPDLAWKPFWNQMAWERQEKAAES